MRILLVQPAPFEPGRVGLENAIWFPEPVGLTTIAAIVPEHEVKILDMRLEADTVYNETLLSFQPQVVGTTSMTTDCYQAKALLSCAKQTLGRDVFTIVGGHHPTLAPWDFQHDDVNALCMGEGEETFLELVEHLDDGGAPKDLHHINGLRFCQPDGAWHSTPKRHQNRELDSFPAPRRDLLPKRYRDEYFFAVAGPMASMATSRGCAFDCNFCAIWEFYEKKVRFLSAKAICDQIETMEEKVVFFLDDNFLTSKKRLNELADEMERRKIKKWWGTQGRTDFIADNPKLMKRLRDVGLVMVLSGYESNDEQGLSFVLKRNSADKNRIAAKLLRDLGIISTGIFMVRPDFTEEDFDTMYAGINDQGVAIPIITVWTPLPGTQLYREMKDQLLTRDARLFDLLHAVVPTKLPRERFYAKLAESNQATWPSFEKGTFTVMRNRPLFFADQWRGTMRFLKRIRQYTPIYEDPASHMRDEIGIIEDVRLQQGDLPVVVDGKFVPRVQPETVTPKRAPRRQAHGALV
jgi:hopanoid C-3 methylase